jgi:predicted ATP-grasp superfamily ATP-dependent carboligase
VPVTGSAHDGELAARLDLRRSRYEGPTGITGVLHDTFARRDVPSASLWAAVPHYIATNTNPAAALALVRQLENILEVQLHPDELESASEVFLRQIAQVLESDEETAAYVSELERRDGEDDEDDEIPTGDELAEELQRFLRERRERPDDAS